MACTSFGGWLWSTRDLPCCIQKGRHVPSLVLFLSWACQSAVSCQRSCSQYFPHLLWTGSLNIGDVCFSNRELKELETSLRALPYQVEAGPSSSSRVRTMSILRLSPSSVAACCSHCLTDARATIVEVIAPPSTHAISWILTRAVSSCLTLGLKQYGRAGDLKAFLLYIACRPETLMTPDSESGPWMPFNSWVLLWSNNRAQSPCCLPSHDSFWRQHWSQHSFKAQPSKVWVRDELLFPFVVWG